MPDFKPIRRLGNGHFGEVHLAQDQAVNELRAVKFVPAANVVDPNNVYSEPQTLTQLRHENIVTVYDAGPTSDGIYVSMEFLPDGSVTDRFGSGPLPIGLALSMVCDACRGLQYAHDMGFLHLDLKPGNLLVSADGIVKLSDFGLASPAGLPGAAISYTFHRSPEMVAGEPPTVLTDVYAMGATLCRLVKGDADALPPVPPGELADRIARGRFPERSRWDIHVPKAVRSAIRKSMAVDRTKRTASASAFRHSLERATPEVSFARTPGGAGIDHSWAGQSTAHEYSVVVAQIRGGSQVIVRQCQLGGQPRRVGELCSRHDDSAQALAAAEIVLQGLGSPKR